MRAGIGKERGNLVILALSVLAVSLVMSAFTGIWPLSGNVYNTYALQAKAWLSGSLSLPENYLHLELAVYNGRYYCSFPPLPSLILLPFVVAFGESTPDHLLTLLAAAAGVCIAYKTARALNKTPDEALFWALFLGVGGNLVFVMHSGGVWFMAQSFSFLFTVAAFYFSIRGGSYSEPQDGTGASQSGRETARSLCLSLVMLALAFGCRPFQIVYLPILALPFLSRFLKEKPRGTKLLKGWLLPLLPALLLGLGYMLLNYLRFRNPFEFGHNFLPEFLESENGQFSLAYLAENLKKMFSLPGIASVGKIDFPAFNGFAFWLVSPIFLALPVSLLTGEKGNRRQLGAALLAVLLMLIHLLLICSHKTLGGWHFGNRYTVDMLPVAFATIMLLKSRISYRWYLPLLILGACLNVAGTIAAWQQLQIQRASLPIYF